jgi:hypothetical protein
VPFFPKYRVYLIPFRAINEENLKIKIGIKKAEKGDKKMRYVSLVLVLLLVLAVGCTKIEGKKIDGAKTKDILAPGTNESKVVQMFGEPQQKESLANGETKYIYYYRESRGLLWHADAKDQQRLEVFLKGNEVQRYRYVHMDVTPITTDVPPVLPEKK